MGILDFLGLRKPTPAPPEVKDRFPGCEVIDAGGVGIAAPPSDYSDANCFRVAEVVCAIASACGARAAEIGPRIGEINPLLRLVYDILLLDLRASAAGNAYLDSAIKSVERRRLVVRSHFRGEDFTAQGGYESVADAFVHGLATFARSGCSRDRIDGLLVWLLDGGAKYRTTEGVEWIRRAKERGKAAQFPFMHVKGYRSRDILRDFVECCYRDLPLESATAWATLDEMEESGVAHLLMSGACRWAFENAATAPTMSEARR